MTDQKKSEKKAAMLVALEDGCTWEEAAARIGVGASTIYRWCNADPELAALAQEAKDSADDQVEAVMFRNCLDPDPSHNTARIFWLKNRRKEVFGEKIQADILSAGRPIRPTIVEVLESTRRPTEGQDAGPL